MRRARDMGFSNNYKFRSVHGEISISRYSCTTYSLVHRGNILVRSYIGEQCCSMIQSLQSPSRDGVTAPHVPYHNKPGRRCTSEINALTPPSSAQLGIKLNITNDPIPFLIWHYCGMAAGGAPEWGAIFRETTAQISPGPTNCNGFSANSKVLQESALCGLMCWNELLLIILAASNPMDIHVRCGDIM